MTSTPEEAASLFVLFTASAEVRLARFVSQAGATPNAAPADADGVLAALRTLDLSTATFASDPAAPRHLGPAAQAFHLAFGLGADDGTIAPADMAGVALAAVKALDARVTALPRVWNDRPARPARRARPAAPEQSAPLNRRPRWPDGASRGSNAATSASRGALPGSSVRCNG